MRAGVCRPRTVARVLSAAAARADHTGVSAETNENPNDVPSNNTYILERKMRVQLSRPLHNDRPRATLTDSLVRIRVQAPCTEIGPEHPAAPDLTQNSTPYVFYLRRNTISQS